MLYTNINFKDEESVLKDSQLFIAVVIILIVAGIILIIFLSIKIHREKVKYAVWEKVIENTCLELINK